MTLCPELPWLRAGLRGNEVLCIRQSNTYLLSRTTTVILQKPVSSFLHSTTKAVLAADSEEAQQSLVISSTKRVSSGVCGMLGQEYCR